MRKPRDRCSSGPQSRPPPDRQRQALILRIVESVKSITPQLHHFSPSSQIQPLHLRVHEQPLAGTFVAILAELEHVTAIGDRERTRGILLDDHERETATLHLEQLVE